MTTVRISRWLRIGLFLGSIGSFPLAFSHPAEDAALSASATALAGSIPTDGELKAALDTPIELRFQNPLAARSVDTSTVSLLGPNGPLPIAVKLDSDGKKVQVQTKGELFPGSRYTVFVSGAQFAEGTPLPLTVLSFKTQSVSSEETAKAATAKPSANDNSGLINASDVLKATSTFDGRAKHLSTGPQQATQGLTSECDNKEAFRGYLFCHKKGRIDGGIFTPGFDNTDARWRLNTPLPALPSIGDFPAGAFPKGKTALFGIVRRIDDQPVAGVAVSIGDLSTRTDAQGRFALIGTPTGRQILVVDGSTANRGSEEYGQFTASVELKAQEINRVPYNLFLPRIDARDKIHIPSPTTEDLVVGHPAIPGLSIQIPAGTVLRNRQGQVITEFAVVPMPVDRSPIPAPANFPVYVSMQPGDATVESLTTSGATGLRVIYPNYTVENSKEQGFWYYDTDRGSWEVYASGHVSEEGNAVVPISNYGLRILMPQGGASIGGPDPPPPLRCSSGGVSDGDPVDCASGAFVHSRTDLAVADTPPLAFTRTYSSQDTVLRGFGRGATNNYAMYLHVPEGSCYGIYTSTGTEMDLVTGDGAVYPFFLVSGATRNTGVLLHTSTPTRFYGAIMVTNNHGDVTVTLTDGTVYRISTGCPTLLQSVTDRFGNTTNLSYNAGLLSQIISSSGRRLTFTYNSNNLVSAVSDNSGRSVSYAYDASKRLTTVTYPDTTTEKYTYDAAGNMLTVTDRSGNIMVTNQYNGSQRVTQQTYADGSTYQFSYTVSGTTATATDVTDGRGNVKHMEFDAAGYLTSLTRANGTALAQITTYTRNAGELLTSITDPLGRTTAMTYNSAGDVLTRTFLSGTPNAITYTYTYTPNYHQIASVKDPLGNTTTYGYTGGCLTSVTDPLGHTTMVSCNGAGQPVAMTDALGHTTTLTYSGSDLQTITDPLSRATTFTSDNLGRTIAVRDPLGRLARVSYDKNGLVTQSVDLLGQATTYAYDGNGNLLSVTDPNGGKTQFSYDARNRRTSRTDALGQAESWTYDAMGNVATFTDRKGQQTSYEYDALNRISKITYADASTVIPTYDTAGRTTQLVDTVSGTITRSYDALDRLTQEQTSQGSVTYTYDTVGRRATMTPGSQGQISYTYDNADRLTQISQGTEAVAFGYDNANRRTSVTLPNGVVTSYTYDTADQLTGITYATGSGTTLSSLAYTYDAAGQRLSQIGSFLADVLPTATIGTNIFDLNNRQTKWNGVVLGYDKNGDPTANVAANQSYTFDARQQLTQIQDSGTGATLAAFTYDALGRRTSKTIGTTATSFLYDGLDTVQEAQGSNTYSVLTGLGIDERFARSEVGGRYYFLTDALGSTLALTDSSAVVQQKYAYEPYGEMTSTGSSNNPYQFTGRENDSTGLYYYRARYYSPRLKRFISEDPKGLAAGLNSYAYVGGNPVSLVDPNGLEGVGPWTFAPGPDRDGYYASLRCSQRFGERVNRRFIETHNFFPGFFAPPGMGLLLGSGRAAATALGVPTLTEAAGLQVVNSLISEPLYINWSGAFRGASLSYFGVAAAWESGLYTGTVIYVGLTDSDCGCSR